MPRDENATPAADASLSGDSTRSGDAKAQRLTRRLGNAGDAITSLAARLVSLPSHEPAHDERGVAAAILAAGGALGLGAGSMGGEVPEHPNVLFQLDGARPGPHVVVEHPSGLKLVDLADIVVDIGGVVGDGVVELPSVDTAVGPTSGAALVVAAWAILVRAAELLVERGLTPLVYRSVQVPGAEALFHERMATYARTREGFTRGT